MRGAALSRARVASIDDMTLIVKQVDGTPAAATCQPWAIGPCRRDTADLEPHERKEDS